MSRHVWKRCFFLLAAVLLAAFISGCTGPEGSVAFTVNGLEVEKAELLYYMTQNTSVVAAELETTYALDSTAEDFWTSEEQGIQPLEYLKEYTVREITRTKVEQLLAKECGVKTALYYSQQRREQADLNKQRREAEAAGEILYGPTERDFTTYFMEFYLAMEKSLQEKLLERGDIQVSIDEVRNYYYNNSARLSGSFEENQGVIYTELLKKAYETFIDGKAEAASVQEVDMAVKAEEVV